MNPKMANWRLRRFLYYGGHCVLFALIAYFGSNYFLFGKLTRLTPDDFIPQIRRDCVPFVRALKAYERDHGKLPGRIEELIPGYLAKEPHAFMKIDGSTVYTYGAYNHHVIYDFSPQHEGWRVNGEFANGPVSLPPVVAPASTRPVARPD